MEMMEPNNRIIELVSPEDYRKKHPKKTTTTNFGSDWQNSYRRNNFGFGGGFGKTDDDICTIYD